MKRTMKKILCSLLAVIICMTAAPLQGFTDFDWSWLDFGIKASALSLTGKCGDNVSYTYDSSTGVVVISGTGSMYDYDYKSSPFRQSNIKAVVVEDGVTSIGDYAFRYCDSLTSITLPDSVTSVRDYAFGSCKYLTSITLPDSVTFIGDYAFNGCDSLTSITIPDGVTAIGDGTFDGCDSLTSITIPDSVTSIGYVAFAYCDSLTSITIPDSVTSIGSYAFYDCGSLTNITPPDSVTSIGPYAFGRCTSLTNTTLPAGITSISHHMFEFCYSLTSIIIPDGVTSIGGEAFYCCRSLTSIIIPDSVTTIGAWAFDSCSSLTNITLPDSVTVIGDRAFGDCSSLTSIIIPDGVTIIEDHAFYDCSSLTSITIPDGVTSIGDCAFDGCFSLASITIPDRVNYIGKGAFSECSSLTSITIPNRVKFIGDYTFAYCDFLTNITIPDGVTSIGAWAFQYCDTLSSISIPASVATIEYSAFKGCDQLTDVYYLGTQEQWENISIDNGNDCLLNATIHVDYVSVYDCEVSGHKYVDGVCSVSGCEAKESIPFTLDNILGLNYSSTYSDNYFSGSSYVYNHNLAIISNCLAISTMIKSKSNAFPVCAKSFFKTFGFKNYASYGYGVSPQCNSIACVMARKKLGKTTIIAIGIRGAGYDAEWGGNFTVGTAEEHEGFRIAKESVLEYLSEYIKNNNINGYVKFWISGYSRAAATANLVAAALDEGANGYDYISSLNYGPEDVYAYTFETPMPTRDKKTKDKLYTNIFNIINRIDYVPKVAPEVWEYSRYGMDCYLPSPETYGKEYSTLFNKMKTQYKNITGEEYTENFTFYDAKFSVNTNDGVDFVAVNGNISLSRYFDEFIPIVAKNILKSPSYYTNNYQSTVQKLLVSFLGDSENVEIPENTKNEIMTALVEGIKSNIFGVFNDTWRINLATILSSIDKLNLSYSDSYNILGIVDEAIGTSIVEYNYVYTLIKNFENIKPAHSPQMNFAWVTALDGETITQKNNGKRYRIIKYNCPIDIKLYDEEDNLLATICGDDIDMAEDCYLSIYIDANGQKCFCLPEDVKYRFEITGTDDGEMNCTFNTYDFTTGQTTETVNYYNISISEGSQFFVEIDSKESDSDVPTESLAEQIFITNEADEEIETSEILDSEDTTITVSVKSDSLLSYAMGGGIYIKGEFAKVEAYADKSEVFVGWYIDDQLVSTDIAYRFMPERDCQIVANWTSSCSVNGHIESEWITDNDATCSIEGSKHIECTICEEVLKTEQISKLPHNYNTVVTAPTCEDKGYTTYTCACGAGYVDDYVKEKGHTYTSVITKKADCTNAGLKTYTCSVCNNSYTEDIPKLGHNFSKEFTVDKEATYTESGLKSKHCLRNGCSEKSEAVEIPKLEAVFSDSDTAKIKGTFVVAVTQTTVGQILAQAGSGAYISDKNGKQVAGDAYPGTGMTLTLSDGKKYTVVVLGDIDGDSKATAADARLALRASVGLESYTEASARYKAANVQPDGKVTAADARLILRASVGLENPQSWLK